MASCLSLSIASLLRWASGVCSFLAAPAYSLSSDPLSKAAYFSETSLK